MPQYSGLSWLHQHWDESYLPNNEWVAATGNGLVANALSLDDVISEAVENNSLDQLAFAFVTFDLCQ